MRNLFLLLALIVAGVQSASADNIYEYERDTVIMNGVYYETNFLVNNYYLLGSNNYYNASIIHLLTAGTSLSVPSEITIDNKAYKVRSVGKHTYLKGYPTRYFFDSSVPTNPGWRSEWKDDTGFHFGPDGALNTDWEYSAVPINFSNSGLKNLTFQGGIEIYGPFTSNSLETLNFQGDATIKGDMLVVGLRNLNLNGALDISGTLTSDRLTEIHFNNLTCSGKFECKSLTDVYFPTLKYGWIGFSGFGFTGVSFSGSQWEDHFPSSLKKKIRAHVWDLTSEQLAKLKNSAIWCDFKEIVNHKSNVNYTITSDGNARINFVELKGNASYVSATGISQLASAYSGSKSGTVKSGGNYAVEIRDVDFDTKNVQLLRNGSVATLEPYEDQGQPLRYHEDLDLQQDVRYEVSVSDKVCTVSFIQGENYTGRILYQKSYNGTTSTGVVTGASPTVACAQGSQLKLTIPYDQYTPNVLRLNGSTVSMTKANGEATATITVPAAATAEVDLTWQAPQQQDPPHHQPEIMIMRSGEGDILFKGLCAPEEQAQEAYEQQFGYPAENGVVVSAVSNCTNTVTTVTVPDYDYLGRGADYTFDATEWGFRAEITPVAGQTLKTLLVGYIDEEDGRETIIWEDLLYGENYGMYVHPEYRYVHYNESTNTYTLNWGFDEMNVWIGDYVVNIAMGPEETAVETGATLNFVRQGGRTEVLFEKEDVDGTLTDQVIGEGSMSFNLKYFTEAELEDAGMNYYQLLWFNPVEGETIHVFCDGTDITSQLIYNSETGNARLELERKNHTYTILIEDAPNANPTWTIHNATEADVVVEQTLKDGTTTTTTFAGNLNDLVIDDTQVSKVTLKVYAENANEAKPVRVLVNGQDVSYQFSTMPNDGDGFRLCYEVPVSELTNCSWDISYNTDHAQTFVVKGGTRDLLVDFGREILYGGPVFSIFRNDGPATIYLPPFNSEYNSNIDMMVYANAGEGVTIKRNGVDVTALFEEKAESGYKYYDLDINDADFEGDNTVSQFGFDIRDAAVWEIVYKSVEEQMKTLRVSNLDQMEIVYERNYTDGSTASEYFKNAETGEIAKYVERIFDDSDRENTRFIYLHVPIPESQPIRVLCNGEDVTYSKHDEWINEDRVTYIASMTQDQTWDISYDTSHKQTFIVKGGLYPEVNYEYKAGDISKDVQVGGITEVCLPDYNSDYDNTYADFTIGTLPNESFTALRNGVDVTDKFTKEVVSDNLWRYTFNFDNSDVAAALGVDLRDPAVWQITIGDTGRYDLNNDNKVDISDVTKLVNKVLNR